MKKLSFFAAVLLFFSVMAHATIRRIGFFGTPVSGVDYSSLQLAHDASTAGDTIMMMPGATTQATFTKRLVVIGPGYFLDPTSTSYPGNSGLQANPNSSNGGVISFNAGSSSTQVLGCTLSGANFNDASLTGILIKRCFFTYTQAINFTASASNITFQQCVISYLVTQSNSTTVSNLSFLNCLFDNFGSSGFSLPVSSSGLVNNCVFASTTTQNFGPGAWQIQNCIAQSSSFAGTNIVFNNNVGTSTQFPTGNGNQQSKPWNTIFTLTGSYDGKYALKTGSPAIGAGVGGIDAGIFGGTVPYRLSGIPSVPTIYALTSPQGTTPSGNTVQINLSTRSNN